MRLPNPIPVQHLAEKFGARLLGNDNLQATGINEVHHVEAGDITFVDFEKYYQKALESKATIILIDKEAEVPEGKALLVLDQPFKAYDALVREYRPFQPVTAQVSPSAQIGEGTIIEPGAVIGHEVVIGKNCYIQANVYIGDYTSIGNEVTIEAGAAIGTDAFYFKRTDAGYEKWCSGGRVVIEDKVSIGANCTINKGVSSDTVIGEGTKLDCQVQIGHDTKIGRHCLFAAQVGVAGNTIVGDKVILYGQVGIAQNLHIGDGAVVLAKSGVRKDINPKEVHFGYPAKEARGVYKELAALRQLPDLLRKIKGKL